MVLSTEERDFISAQRLFESTVAFTIFVSTTPSFLIDKKKVFLMPKVEALNDKQIHLRSARCTQLVNPGPVHTGARVGPVVGGAQVAAAGGGIFKFVEL
jgi:hypothetical protein